MSNRQLGDIFNEMADIMEILGEEPFRINSCRKAARTIHDLTDDIADLIDQDNLAEKIQASRARDPLRDARLKRLSALAGIGKSSAEKILEFHETGHITAHVQLRDQIPDDLLELLDIPGFGPKGVAAVWKNLNVENLDELKTAIENKSLEQLAGFGPKKTQTIAKGIDFLKSSRGRISIAEAFNLAELTVGQLRFRIPNLDRIELAGSLRRCRETIGDIDLLVQADPDAEAELCRDIIDAFTTMPGVTEIIAADAARASVRCQQPHICPETVQIDLRLIPPQSMGAAWQYFTGSREHNVRLREIAGRKKLKLNEVGLFKDDKPLAGENETDIYRKLGMAYIPPTLREDRGEIEAAQKKKLPPLIHQSDIRGDLHMHSPASDGRSPLEDMIETARLMGYEYIAVTDHSRSSAIAGGLDTQRLLEHIESIHAVNARYDDIEIFASSEVDILPDGSLDYDDEILARLDFIMASVHSAMNAPREKNTARVLRALENPYVNCIGHPTGRMLGMREPMDLDMAAIINKAAQTGTALEISSQPHRLDLKDTHIRMAVDAGCPLIINTDAHDTAGLQLIKYGLATAQRGWAEKKHILNTLPLSKFKKWIQTKREKNI